VQRVMGVMCLTHRAFGVFVHLALDLALFVELRIFLECSQVLVSYPSGIEPKLA
jgi:hypothetical protein